MPRKKKVEPKEEVKFYVLADGTQIVTLEITNEDGTVDWDYTAEPMTANPGEVKEEALKVMMGAVIKHGAELGPAELESIIENASIVPIKLSPFVNSFGTRDYKIRDVNKNIVLGEWNNDKMKEKYNELVNELRKDEKEQQEKDKEQSVYGFRPFNAGGVN